MMRAEHRHCPRSIANGIMHQQGVCESLIRSSSEPFWHPTSTRGLT